MLIFLGICFGSQAQAFRDGGRIPDAKMNFKGHQVAGDYVVINYEIPYSGMVEIRLFDDKGAKVWQNQYPHQMGKNRIILRAAAFKRGMTYDYTLNYKKDEVRESILIPADGF